MSETETAPRIEKHGTKSPRPVGVIEGEITKARVRFAELQKQIVVYAKQRKMQDEMIKVQEAIWKSTPSGAGMPFDPHAFNPPALPLPEGTPLTESFHAQHQVLRNLDNELEAARAILREGY